MLLLAMDRAIPNRRYDVDGRLRVTESNISKANVCPYLGHEIPGWQSLGLQPDRVYNMLRHPEELAAAVDTFNELPVLHVHAPVSAYDEESHKPELVVGTTGSNATFDGTYLKNGITVWARRAIDGIESNRKRELSAGYRYTPDMTPGNYEGLQYDGIMRNIVGNHVALVISGRAGPDVLVGDERMKLKSRTALMVSGALAALVRPKLAADAKVDITDVLEGIDGTTLALDGMPRQIADKLVPLVTPHLAADQALTAEEVEAAVGTVEPSTDDDAIPETQAPAGAPAPKNDPAPKPGQPKPDAAPAMDAATVQGIADKARADALAEAARIRTAERAVAPFVGEVPAMDSAAAVYKLALDAAKVDLTGVDESAYPALVALLPKPDAKSDIVTVDHKSSVGMFDKLAPNRAQLVQS